MSLHAKGSKAKHQWVAVTTAATSTTQPQPSSNNSNNNNNTTTSTAISIKPVRRKSIPAWQEEERKDTEFDLETIGRFQRRRSKVVEGTGEGAGGGGEVHATTSQEQ